MTSILPLILAIVLSPSLLGLINVIKAKWGGRVGPPIWQNYLNIIKMLGKGAVYSGSTTWLVKGGPIIALASTTVAILIVPMGGIPGLLFFPGDFILFAYILGIGRFFTVLAGLDTASAFCGMGGSREVFYSALAEIAFLLGLAALAIQAHTLSLTGLFSAESSFDLAPTILIIFSLFVVVLCENSKMPVVDPNTHLELKMLHEVMVLDHGGPDLGIVEYEAGMKLWVFSLVLSQVFMPITGTNLMADVAMTLVGLYLVVAAIGVTECIMARFKILQVPKILVGATAISVLSILLAVK